MPQDQPKAHPDQPTGTDVLGGTRAGAENVEPVGGNGVRSDPDVDKTEPLDQSSAPDLANQHGEHAEGTPKSDEGERS